MNREVGDGFPFSYVSNFCYNHNVEVCKVYRFFVVLDRHT